MRNRKLSIGVALLVALMVLAVVVGLRASGTLALGSDKDEAPQR